MDSQQPIAPGYEQADSRRTLIAWILIALVLYAAYVAACFYMEAEGRSRFEVPTKADIEAIDERTARLRAETARGHALAEMREWTPFAVYTASVGAIILLGSLVATILGSIVVWRGVRRDSVRKARVIVLGVLFILMGSLFLLGWPQVVAERVAESKRTDFELPVGPVKPAPQSGEAP